MSKSSFAGRVGLATIGAAALLVGLTASDAMARYGGHPGATGRANGGTCNRCHSPQTYDGLSIELPIEYRHDCYQPIVGGYQLTNSFYAIPYTPQEQSAPLSEVPVTLRLAEPPLVEPGAEEVGIFCPDIAQVQPAQECTSPADCGPGQDLCQDFGSVVQEVEEFGFPGSCTTGEEQFQVEADCGEEGALCANDICARRVERAINTCGRTLPACQPGNVAGFAIEVTNLAEVLPGQPVLKPAADEQAGAMKQAVYNNEGSTTEVNHAVPRAFDNGEISWGLTLVAPRYNVNNAVQNVTLYASANSCNQNGVADIGDVTAVAQLPVYFEVPGTNANTGPDCLEGEVCRGGEVLGEDLICRCPEGYELQGEAGLETCTAAGGCDCNLGSDKPFGAGLALVLGLGIAFRRRRKG
jgi:MYXO-CTERM domain-containing protein